MIRLAVECKNLQPTAPLLVSCLPRTLDESFHEVIISVHGEKYSLISQREQLSEYSLSSEPSAKNVRLTRYDSIYKVGEPVGKCCDQVRRDAHTQLVSNDADVYEKWSQAVASAQDLVERSCGDAARLQRPAQFAFVLPVLVVPNGTLWETLYGDDGNCTSTPALTDRCSFFINKFYFAHHSVHGTGYKVSHLEFVTTSGLETLVRCLLKNSELVVFPMQSILDKYERYVLTGIENDGAM